LKAVVKSDLAHNLLVIHGLERVGAIGVEEIMGDTVKGVRM